MGRLFFAILGASLFASTVMAQDTPDPGDASAQVDTSEAQSPQEVEAMQRFADANALFERGDRAGALAEMQRVYELLDGNANQYIVLYNLGRVYEELFQYDRAIELYNRYIAESPADASDRPDAQASLRALERLLGTIVITTNAPRASVWIGEQEVGTAPGEMRIAAGHHALELRAPGYESVRREIDVAGRDRLELDIPLAQLSDFRGITPAVFIATSAGAVLALGVAIGLGLNARGLHDNAVACNTTPRCQIDVESRQHEIQNWSLAADVTYGAAGLLAITSVVLAFVTDWGGAPASATAPTARFVPTLGGGVFTLTF